MSRATFARASRFLYGASLITLPLVGMGVVRLLTGTDTGAGFQLSYICLALASLAAWLAWRRPFLWHRLRVEPAWSWLWLAVLVAVAVSVAGLWIYPAEAPASQRLLRFVKQSVQLFIMICFMASPLLWSGRIFSWSLTWRLLGVALLGQLLYGAVQGLHFYRPVPGFAIVDSWFTSNPAILSGSEELFLGTSFRGIPRLRGTMCEPLYLGNFLLLVVPGLLHAFGRRRWLWLLPMAGGILLLLTWARGAYLGALVAGLTATVLMLRARIRPCWRRWLWRVGLVTLAIVITVLVLMGADALWLPWHRILQSVNEGDWSNLTRLYSMQAGWRAFCASPVVGVGWGQFGYHFPLLVDPTGLQSQFAWPVVNNYPLQILCETGLVGFLVFLAGTGWLTARVWSAVGPTTEVGRRLGREGRVQVIALAAATTGVWSQLLTFSQYNLPHIWVAVGLLLAALQAGESGAEWDSPTALVGNATPQAKDGGHA